MAPSSAATRARSLWDWHTLPDYKAPRYTDYARANASLGINGTVLTNVNANATSLTPTYSPRRRRSPTSSVRTASACTSPPASARRSRSAG